MNLYCDTSGLIKLYIDEAGSTQTATLATQADLVATSRISWAEAFAALARRGREIEEDQDSIEIAKANFRNDWNQYLILEVTQPVVTLASEYAETFALRGYDGVQLATASTLQQQLSTSVTFACFDRRLNRAAKVLGMETPFDSQTPPLDFIK